MIEPLATYAFAPGKDWVQFTSWLAVVEKARRSKRRQPDKVSFYRHQFYQRISGGVRLRAALELPFGELSQWCARTKARSDGIDRQVILGGIYDRYSMLRAAKWLRHTDPQDAVRLLAFPAWSRAGVDETVLTAVHPEWTIMLMCCRRGTAHGDDPLPRGLRGG